MDDIHPHSLLLGAQPHSSLSQWMLCLDVYILTYMQRWWWCATFFLAQVIKTFFIPLNTSQPLYTQTYVMCIFISFSSFILQAAIALYIFRQRQTSLDYIWFVLFCFISYNKTLRWETIITRTFLCDMEKIK